MTDCNGILRTIFRRGRRSVRPIAYLLVAALAVLGTVGVLADEAAPPTPVTFSVTATKGTVTAVSGSAITVKQADGTTTTVNVSDKTGYMATVTSAVSNIKLGDMVAVKGDKTGDNAYHATGLTIMGAPVIVQSGPGGKTIPGGGTAITGTPPPLPADATCKPMNASPGAVYISGTPGGLPPGALQVPISGTVPSGTEKGAVGCFVNGKPGDGTLPVLGKVTQINGATLTLQAPDGTTITVTTDAQTAVNANQQSSLSAIKAGDTVMIGATKADDGSFTALFVHDGALDI